MNDFNIKDFTMRILMLMMIVALGTMQLNAQKDAKDDAKSDYITFYFQGPSWMDNNPHVPEVWGPFTGDPWTQHTFTAIPGSNWWTAEVEVTDAAASITYQMRFSQGGATKYQKATGNFGADPSFTTTSNQIWIDASDNASFTWNINDFYLSADKITETNPAPPTKLLISTINPSTPVENQIFTLSVKTQDAEGKPSPVSTDTEITITKISGSGTISGTVTKTVSTGKDSIVFTDLTLSAADTYELQAETISGMTLTSDQTSVTVIDASTPNISLSVTELNGFTYEEGNGPSATQFFTVGGINLTNDVSIAIPTNYELSLIESPFSAEATAIALTPTGGTLSPTNIYVRLKSGLTVNAFNEDLSITSTGATGKTVSLIGEVTEFIPPVANYGLRDDGGVNLPTVTYWYTGQSTDLTQYGTEFTAETPGEVSVFSIKGAAIKTWKNDGGDVTGAQFNYKVWANGDTEPVDYTTIDVNWTSNDATKETSLQTWADFGAPIDLADGLAAGIYNVKIHFSISGTGTAGTTENGPHSLQFTIPALSSAAEITAFTLPEQTGDATINSSEATITIEVENGTYLTNLTPTIAISAGATISPESGVAQDFTDPVTYTVTAENTSVSKIWTITVTEAAPPAANYGLRDDGGVNLPTVTYWYTGQATDLTQYGTEFAAETPGEVSVFSIKGAAIKTWKNGEGDVTGAQYNYKVWADGDTEPVDYTTIDVGWTSNDATKETSLQTWADFGTAIDLADGLAAGIYNVKILFSISGTGTAGTTENGPHSLQFTIPALSSAAEITAFTLPEQTGDATINSSEATVSIEVSNGTDISNLIPTIAISTGATISPESGVAQNFTDPVSYTVTAENTSVSKIWTVTVTEAAPPAANYGLRDDGGVNLPTVTYWYTGQSTDLTQYGTEFAAETPGEVSVFSIKGAAIKTWKNGEGDVTGAQFNYKVWADGDTEPVDYTTIDLGFTSTDDTKETILQTWADFGVPIDLADGLAAGIYNVKILFSINGTGTAGTTEDGPHSLQFTIPALSSAAEITAFTLPEQTGDATINSSEATVSIEVSNGTDISNLIPTIAISAGATISPESGVAQDFTDPVTYTVTAENTSVSKIWTITVTEAAPPAANYGLRDDGGVNLPTVTYWYTGQATDLTQYGTEFAAETPGEVSVFSIKGAAIKTWKNDGGDVTGAQFNYKVWADGNTEPVDYTTIDVNWTSNDATKETSLQTWADFGTAIDLADGLAAGTYNVKILFSISGTGNPGITENGPFETSFTKAGASGDLTIMDTWVAFTRNGTQTTLTGSNFDNFDLGTFHPDIPFVIKGGGIKTQNDGYNEFVSATMYYRVYKTNEAPGDFSEIDLPFAENLPEAGQQVWETLVESISVTADFNSNDSYYLEVYFDATYETPGGSELGTITDDNNGGNYTAQFTFSTALSLNDFNAPQIILYPNPSNAYSTISWTTDLPVNNINIKNITGQTIEIIIPTSTNQQINLSNYSSGVYFIELSTDTNIIVKKLIIK